MQFSRGFWGLQVFLPYQFHMNTAESNKHFDKIGKGKERVVKCKYCKQTMTSADTDRWRSHLTTNCKLISAELPSLPKGYTLTVANSKPSSPHRHRQMSNSCNLSWESAIGSATLSPISRLSPTALQNSQKSRLRGIGIITIKPRS